MLEKNPSERYPDESLIALEAMINFVADFCKERGISFLAGAAEYSPITGEEIFIYSSTGPHSSLVGMTNILLTKVVSSD